MIGVMMMVLLTFKVHGGIVSNANHYFTPLLFVFVRIVIHSPDTVGVAKDD